MSEQNSELLLSMLRDLNNKVDGLPTRHEFDAFNARFDDMQDKFDKYVLKSEFDTYKSLAEARLRSEVKTMADRHVALSSQVESHDEEIEKFKSNRLPSWAFPIILAISTIAVQIWGNFSHNQQMWTNQQQTPAAVNQRISH